MPDYQNEPYYSVSYQPEKKLRKNNIVLNIVLFIITFVTTTIAGLQWTTNTFGNFTFESLALGLPYSISILFILASHEFGHYFAARYHKVKATLPYFIPIPSIPELFFINFGTMGAVIKTKSAVQNNKAMFDIGVSGPIAGFAACLIVLIYGFTHLPGVDYILALHPDYFSPEYGKSGILFAFGDSILFTSLRKIFTSPGQFMPPMSEIYHYPYLCVGWFGLLVTGMNMIPVGQLDGGHVIYSMFGSKKQVIISWTFMAMLLAMGIPGVFRDFLNMDIGFGWTGWLFWAIILFFVIKVKHPPVYEFVKLDTKRILLGYLSLFIFLVSIAPTPFILEIRV